MLTQIIERIERRVGRLEPREVRGVLAALAPYDRLALKARKMAEGQTCGIDYFSTPHRIWPKRRP
jgi:hypothetical protein